MNTNIKRQASLGGQVMAKRQREVALKKYYLNPKHCKNCSKIIKIKEREKVSQVRKKIFCDHSCAAIFNQKGKPSKNRGNLKIKESTCNYCGGKFIKSRTKNGSISKSKYCETCKTHKHNNVQRSKETRTSNIELITKEELFNSRKNWQSARSTIRKHAWKIFKQSGKELKCKICEYTIYVEVCHIKDVKDFLGNTKIIEINSISNLVPLCPNHHWEFDNGLLKL